MSKVFFEELALPQGGPFDFAQVRRANVQPPPEEQ